MKVKIQTLPTKSSLIEVGRTVAVLSKTRILLSLKNGHNNMQNLMNHILESSANTFLRRIKLKLSCQKMSAALMHMVAQTCTENSNSLVCVF